MILSIKTIGKCGAACLVWLKFCVFLNIQAYNDINLHFLLKKVKFLLSKANGCLNFLGKHIHAGNHAYGKLRCKNVVIYRFTSDIFIQKFKN